MSRSEDKVKEAPPASAPAPEPVKEMSLNERRLAITAILKDSSLSGAEKQKRVAALRPPPQARTKTQTQQGGEESEATKRRKAIQAVHADKSLTPNEKHAKIQELLNQK
jgi:hypothetical protein